LKKKAKKLGAGIGVALPTAITVKILVDVIFAMMGLK